VLQILEENEVARMPRHQRRDLEIRFTLDRDGPLD
jgi:hypothetical protein